MIYFTHLETIDYIISALLYGTAFGFFCQLINIISFTFTWILKLPSLTFSYKGSLFSLVTQNGNIGTNFQVQNPPRGSILSKKENLREKNTFSELRKKLKRLFDDFKIVIEVILFCVGFILLSYLYGDGDIRAYTILISIFGYLITVNYLCPHSLIFRLIILVLNTLTLVLRIATLPIRPFYIFFCKIFLKFTENITRSAPLLTPKSIDNNQLK